MRKLPPHNFSGAPGWDEALFKAAHATTPPISIRLNPQKPLSTVISEEEVPWCANGRYLLERPIFTLDPHYHCGNYYVQEASSMFVEQAFSQTVAFTEASLKVLDLCAAPGGKSTLLASLLRPQDLLVSNEVIQSRAGILVENMSRWGQMNTWVTNNDPKDFGRAPGFFDVLLVDAPCSGSGLWRKDEKAIDEWSREVVLMCSERQKRILADAYTALKKEGILIYATCSFSKEENEDILDWIGDTFEVETIALKTAVEWGVVTTESDKHRHFGYRFFPWQVKGEGFFIAVFRKKDGIVTDTFYNSKVVKPIAAKSLLEAKLRWNDFLDVPFELEPVNDIYFGIHPEHAAYFSGLKSNFYIKKAGTALGQLTRREAIPEHELAMSVHVAKSLPAVDLEIGTALRFLKKDILENTHGVKGWQLAKFDGWPLGWGKWLPNRVNNYLPKNLRIRMDLS